MKRNEYHALCDEADSLVPLNVCDWRNSRCRRDREREASGISIVTPGCCGAYWAEPRCEYLTDTGCTVKNLDCKVWLCPIAEHYFRSVHPEKYLQFQAFIDRSGEYLRQSRSLPKLED